MTANFLKMKYRFLLTVLLPSLIFLLFLSGYLYKDYNTMKRMQSVEAMNSTMDEMSRFVNSLIEEKDLTFVMAQENPPAFQEELQNAQMLTDKNADALKESLQTAIKGNIYLSNSTKQYLDRLNNNLDTLKQKREISEQKGTSNLADFYDLTLKEALNAIVEIGRDSVDLDIALTLFSLANLVNETLALSEERIVGADLINRKEQDFQKILKFSNAVTKQEAYRIAYFQTANNSEDDMYLQILKNQAGSELTKIRENFLNPSTQNDKIDVKSWWNLVSNRLNILAQLEGKLIDYNQTFAKNLEANKRYELYLIFSILFLTLLTTLFFTFYNLKVLANKIQEEVEVLASSGQEILSSITEASSGTSETAAAVSETTTTVEELKQTAQLAAEKAKNVSEVSDDALKVLQSSEKSLESTIQGMSRIQDGMGTISESILKLSEQSQAIGKIIDTVNELAEQSHLLAVNAAIEAAKAGDQGKGFGVVAGEVRSLAEQSKQATVQVRAILSEIQNATGAVVMATEQGSKAVANGMSQSKETTDSIRSISDRMNLVAESASQIAITSDQQLIGVGQVTVAMNNIKDASNEQVDHIKQIESGVQSLNHVSNNLKKLVSEYKF